MGQNAGLRDLRSADKQDWEISAQLGSPNGRKGKIATVIFWLSGEIAEWTAAYGRRLRRVLHPEDDLRRGTKDKTRLGNSSNAVHGLHICLDCFMLKETFHEEPSTR
eukprot:SAG31_NODE_16388_length_711_cov_0.805556_2_plen_107_part_00